MKNFYDWAGENNRELYLPVMTDTEEGEKTSDEQRVRTGITHNYPDAYVRAQYPHQWFVPRKATADLDLQQKPASGSGIQKAAN